MDAGYVGSMNIEHEDETYGQTLPYGNFSEVQRARQQKGSIARVMSRLSRSYKAQANDEYFVEVFLYSSLAIRRVGACFGGSNRSDADAVAAFPLGAVERSVGRLKKQR